MPRRREQLLISVLDASRRLTQLFQLALEPGGQISLRIETDHSDRALHFSVSTTQKFAIRGEPRDTLSTVLHGVVEHFRTELESEHMENLMAQLENTRKTIEEGLE